MNTLHTYKQVKLIPYTGELNRVAAWIGIENLLTVIAMWERPERFYHNIQHLVEMLEQYDNADKSDFNELEKDAMLCAIVFHDAVYDPKAEHPENEMRSRELWETYITDAEVSVVEAIRISHGFSEPRESLKQAVKALIDATADHTSTSLSTLEKLFVKWDLWSLASDDLTVLIDAERRVLKEYQLHDYELYRAGRLEILEILKPTILEINPDSKIESLIQYVKARKLKIGIYAGSFNPFHVGHYSILKRAEKVFDKVIIVVGRNPEKKKESYRTEAYRRHKLDEDVLPYHQVEFFEGLLTDYVKSKRTEFVEPSLIKGLGRAGDYEAEKMQMRYMEDMDPDINVAFFISHRAFDYVSSSGARIVEELNPDVYSKYAIGQWPDAEKKMEEL